MPKAGYYARWSKDAQDMDVAGLRMPLGRDGGPAQMVRLPITVLDRQGNFVRDLKAGDFRIVEDKAEQTLQDA